MTFTTDLAWSLEAANTSTAVTFLHAVWPSAQWVTTCQTTDAAGADLMGYRDGRHPIRIDVKHRRVSDARRRYFDATDPDALFDVSYVSSDGQKRPGPIRKYDGHKTPAPCDAYLFTYPDEEPPIALLVAAQAAHFWLTDNAVSLPSYATNTVYSDGLRWTTHFVACPGSLLNACAASNTARLLTVTNGRVTITLP